MELRAGEKMILILDDAEEVRDSTARALNVEGYGTVTVSTVDEAVAILKNVRIDLCIAEVALEGKSSLEFLRMIREDKRFGSLPLILQSASALSVQKETSEFRPIAVYQKPVVLDHLIHAVRITLGS